MSLQPSRRPVAWPLLARQFHTYLSMLIAPSVLMFAVTGGLQIFRLQEAHPGYTPAPIVEKLGRVHKDQVFAVSPPRAARPAAVGAAPRKAAEARRPTPLSKRLLQWFFVVVSAGLFLSTCLGIYMGVTVSRWKVAGRWLVAIGTVLPIVILLLP